MRCRSDDIGTEQRLLPGIDGLPADLLCELLRARTIAARNPDLRELTHAPECLGVRACLHARAEDRKHASVLAREQARRERRTCRGPRRCDVRAVHEGEGHSVVLVEHADQRLVCVAVAILGKERDQLACQAGRGQVCRHGAE